ncbi:hypothetical protein [Pseudomonas canadensis]|uniref:hypothetical protein n=1 Tax=Pseudomonas canadensis TaxID=915099 RepID=UPI0030D700D4
MPAMVVNDDAVHLDKCGVLKFFAGKPAPTEDEKRTHDAKRVAFALAFDLRRPVKPRWPNAGFGAWVTRQDAGLAALGQGWPIAAAHAPKPE